MFYVGQVFLMKYPINGLLRPLLNIGLFADGISLLDKLREEGVSNQYDQLIYAFPGESSLISIYLFLAMDTIIYLMLYYYLIEVFPGNYGTPKPFLFPFQRSFWSQAQNVEQRTSTKVADDEDFVIRIRGLTKEFRPLFGTPKLAVNNLNMDIRRNQITVLLGHNGAGKTTTMSIICGNIGKTWGSIVVDGEDRVDAYRHKIGYCPQHDVSLPFLTTQEHFLFFGRVSKELIGRICKTC